MQEQIPFITEHEKLNWFLNEKFNELWWIKSSCIIDNIGASPVLKDFFQRNSDSKYIINDFVFFEKNKHKINRREIEKEIPLEVKVIFPIFWKRDEVRAFLFLWKKRFSDAYSTQDLKFLLNFSNFLWGHLKYISVYKKIQDLSINLDKKVDEKTIEYNTLLSKQKEFIRYVGHEIKNPITNAIFLCDWLKDLTWKIKDKSIKNNMSEDGAILYQELIKVSELIKHIFSTEQFDLNKIKLYKKEVNIKEFLISEISVLKAAHLWTTFDTSFENVWSAEIDEIQIRQVLQNLVTNAIKFANKEKPRIKISLKNRDGWLLIFCIEDNWAGFSEIDTNNIFNKYSTGDWSSVGLWMWLYLCKKIIELHGGEISAWNSETLWGAQFIITL